MNRLSQICLKSGPNLCQIYRFSPSGFAIEIFLHIVQKQQVSKHFFDKKHYPERVGSQVEFLRFPIGFWTAPPLICSHRRSRNAVFHFR